MGNRFLIVLGIAGLLAGMTACDAAGPTPTPPAKPALPSAQVAVIETSPLQIDGLYPSMTGPMERIQMDVSGMDWITAFRTEIIAADTGEVLGDEFFCHSQLQFTDTRRLIVAATGVSDIRFPVGFGLPLWRNLDYYKKIKQKGGPANPLSFLGMVLNNHEPNIDMTAKIRATIEYHSRDAVGSPPLLKELHTLHIPMTVQELTEYSPSQKNDDVATHCAVVDGNINHWIVPPGRQITRKRYVFEWGSQVHMGVVHLHNYGVYMRITDLTTGELLWQADAAYEPNRVQISEISMYSSVDGFTVHAGHEYEIEALYENTTDHDVDAMAMMYLYHHPAKVPDRVPAG